MAAPDEYGTDRTVIDGIKDFGNSIACVASDLLFLPIACFAKYESSKYYKKLDKFISNLDSHKFVVKGSSFADITKQIKQNNKIKQVNLENTQYDIFISYNEYSTHPIMKIRVETTKWSDDPKELLYTYDTEGNMVNVREIGTYNNFVEYINEFVNYLESNQYSKIANLISICLNES